MKPDLPSCAANIPAMTSEAERLCYYRLAKEAVTRGHVIELGAWVGAATAYLAAAVRDANTRVSGYFDYAKPLQVYDRFIWDASHKAKGATSTDLLGQFRTNLGPLLDLMKVHHGEIANFDWDDLYPVSMIVFDAPKRIPAISNALTTFAYAMRQGTLMVWQDFAYFPSYDIPAVMTRLGRRIQFVEGVYPGTTAVFRVVKPLWGNEREWGEPAAPLNEPWVAGLPRSNKIKELAEDAFDLKAWSADEIEREWDRWAAMLPAEMRPRFQCGAACFLVDNGHVARGKQRLEEIVDAFPEAVLPKWRDLRKDRPTFVSRWRPLFDMLGKMGVL